MKMKTSHKRTANDTEQEREAKAKATDDELARFHHFVTHVRFAGDSFQTTVSLQAAIDFNHALVLALDTAANVRVKIGKELKALEGFRSRTGSLRAFGDASRKWERRVEWFDSLGSWISEMEAVLRQLRGAAETVVSVMKGLAHGELANCLVIANSLSTDKRGWKKTCVGKDEPISE